MIAKLDMLCEQALIHIVLTCYLHVQVCVLVGLPDISPTYLLVGIKIKALFENNFQFLFPGKK